MKDIKKPTTSQEWRISKVDGPAPGSYDYTQSFDKTQKPKEFLVSKQTGNRQSYTDRYAKLFSSNPGAGTYKEIDKGFKQINKHTFDLYASPGKA